MSKFRIGIITGFSNKNSAGLEEFLLGLLEGFASVRAPNVQYRIYTSANNNLEEVLKKRGIEGFEVIPVGFGKWWKHIGLIFAPRSDAYLWNGPSVSPLFFPRHSFVLVYDFAYRYYEKSSLKTRVMDALAGLGFHRAEGVIAISHATANDVTKLFGTPREKLSVAWAGAKDLSTLAETPVEIPLHYFLFVGTTKERKNLLSLVLGYIEAVQEGIPEQLLIAGRNDASSAYGKKIAAAIEQSGIPDRIRFLGHVNDSELVYLYRHSTAFTFPSSFEGFGMPVVEAQRLGVPVLTSNVSSLPEIAGDGALLVSPTDIADIAQGLVRLSKEPTLRAELIRKGRANEKRFSWAGCAKEVLRVLSPA